LEVELLLHLDAGYTEERRELRRHRVREIDHRAEAARRLGRSSLGRRCKRGRGKSCGRGAFEKSTARQRGVYGFLATRYAHGRTSSKSGRPQLAWPAPQRSATGSGIAPSKGFGQNAAM